MSRERSLLNANSDFSNRNIFPLFLTLYMLKGCSFSRPFQWCIFQGLKGCSYFDEGRQRLAFFCHRNWHFHTKIVLLIAIPLEAETRKINFSQLRQTRRAALCTKHCGWNQSRFFLSIIYWFIQDISSCFLKSLIKTKYFQTILVHFLHINLQCYCYWSREKRTWKKLSFSWELKSLIL